MNGATTGAGISGEGTAAGQRGMPLMVPQFSQRHFVALVILLALAAVGLNATVGFLELHFKKEPVPMRHAKFANLPAVVGTWVQVARDENLNPELRASLGTDNYLFCRYIDAAKLGMTPARLQERFKNQPLKQQEEEIKKLLAEYRRSDALLVVALTYYTGKADTVAHVPERCYVGGGYDPVSPADENWPLKSRRETLPVRFIPFENPDTRGFYSNVAYFFHVNGRYESDSLTVRRRLQDLFARHGYYAKVEIMCVTPTGDQGMAAARESMQSFLNDALPHVEAALPDWQQYQSRQ